MELRSVEELMDLLYACRGTRVAPGRGGSAGTDLRQHALRTAALLRRGRPADKELQVAGLVQAIGPLLGPGDRATQSDRAADAVRPLLGERVARLVRAQGQDEDLLRLRQAGEEGHDPSFDAGVLEDWRTVLELLAARNSRLGAVD
ncbi:hypothetical protein [Streptomyces sp. NPDC003635]